MFERSSHGWCLFLQFVKPQKVDFEPRYKKKGRSKTGKKEQRKQGVKMDRKRQQIRQDMREKQKSARSTEQDSNRRQKTTDVLDRFKKKVA